MLKKIMFISLCMVLLAPTFSRVAMALQNAEGAGTISNDFVEVDIESNNGRFAVGTKEGHPLKGGDNQEPLLFMEDEPDTSFTTFRINGENYIYGNSYGFLGTGSSFQNRPTTDPLTNRTQWSVEGLEIVQTLTLIEDPTKSNIGNVKVDYQVRNTTDQRMEVGSRILLDTMLGPEDGSPISMAGNEQFVTHEKTVQGENVPLYWRAVDDPYSPNMISYGFLKGWNNVAPDRMTTAHWSGISTTKWDYQPDADVDFTTSDNPYGTADSAVAMYWDPETLAPGEEATYETYYGLGSFLTSEKQATYALQLTAPRFMQVNEAKDGYIDDEFEIVMEIDNTTENAKREENVKAELSLPSEIELLEGEEASRTISVLERGKTRTVSWRVKANPQTVYKAARYFVSVQAEGGEQIQISRFTVLPSLSGYQPEVQVMDVLPNKKYIYDENRNVIVKGSGFEVLKGSGISDLYLEQQDQTQIEIPDYSIDSNKQMTLNLDKVWDELDAGLYTLHIDAGDYGRFEKTFEMTREEKYKSRSYGLLAVVKQDKTYDLRALPDEEALDQATDDVDEVLLEIRGKINRVADQGQGVFEVEPGATINSVVTFRQSDTVRDLFDTPQTIRVEKKQKDSFHKDDYIDISGVGTLSIPNFPFAAGKFGIEFVDGKKYALEADEAKGEQSIEISWETANWLSKVQRMSFFPITIKNAVLGDDSISFGGTLALNFGAAREKRLDDNPDNDKPFNLAVNLDEARFGLSGQNDDFAFQGLRAQGTVGMPKDLVPGMSFGADASVLIDTLDDIYSVEADVQFKVIEMHGLLTIRFTDSSIPILDDFEFAVGGEPGIPLVSPFVVAYITEGGGGIRNIYDTVMGNFEVLPPLKLVVIGGMDLAKIISASDMRLESSLRGVEFEGQFEILKMDILERMYGSILIEDSWGLNVTATMGADLNVFDIIVGNVNATLSYDESRDGIMGPIYMAGGGKVAIQVPNKIPMAGGQELAGVEARISTEDVFARADLHLATLGVGYDWGDNEPNFDVSSTDSGPLLAAATPGEAETTGLHQEKVYAENSDEVTGVMTYGTNVNRITSSQEQKQPRVSVLANTNGQTYTVPVGDYDNALIELSYDGEKPNLDVFDPNGNPYALKEDENYLVQTIPAEDSESGTLEKYVYVSVDDPASGDWTVQSDKPLGWSLMEVEDLPTLENVTVNSTGERKVQVDWQGIKMDGKQVSLYVAEDREDSGRLLKQGVDASQESATLTLPETAPSGDYEIKAVLHDEGRNYHSKYGDTRITVQNEHEPGAPADVQLMPNGNGLFNVQWAFSEEADGFSLQVLDDNGNPLDNVGLIDVAGDRREANIGGQYEDEATGEKMGVEPGNAYRVAVTPYKEVNGAKVYGTSRESDGVYLPEPNPPTLAFKVEADDGRVIETEDSQGDHLYVTDQQTVRLDMQSDQRIESRIRVNSGEWTEVGSGETLQETVSLQEGDNVIQVKGINEQGDTKVTGVRIKLDSTAPDLKIESPGKTFVTSDAQVGVKGVTEPGSDLTVNSEPVDVGQEGRFETQISMEGYLNRRITVISEDEIGNRTEYIAEGFDRAVDTFEHVEIRPVKSNTVAMASSETTEEKAYEMSQGQSQAFQLVGIDSNDQAHIIHSDDVRWDTLMGESSGTLNENGVLNAQHEGEMVLQASYDLTADYALEDAFIVRIQETNGTPGTDPDQTDDWEDWYIPPETGGDSSDDREDSAVSDASDSNVDQMMEDLLRDIIEAEQGVTYDSYAVLSETEETVIEIDERATLTVFEQAWDERIGIGVGKVNDPSQYATTSLEPVGGIYEIKTSQPVEFEQPPELDIRFVLEDIENINQLGVYWYNEGEQRWEPVNDNVNPLEGTVTAKLEHFSKFALMVNTDQRRFVDMDGRWSEETVHRLASLGVIDGWQRDGAWVFEPQATMTRQAFIKLLAAAGEMELPDHALPDRFVDRNEADAWAVPYLSAFIEKQWLEGTVKNGQPYLEPRKKITRAQAAVLLTRMWEGETTVETNLSSFQDAEQIPSWAEQAVRILRSKEILSGYPDDTFRPANAITREEAAAVVSKWIDQMN